MTLDEFIDKFHIKLNNQQLSAVQAKSGPALVLAVPGSGKTTVLVARLGYLIYCCDVSPESILTITYTVAATKDMKNRFTSYFGEELAERLEFRTINGICAKIISFYGNQIGKSAFKLITDESYKLRLLSQIYMEQKHDYLTENDLKSLVTAISYIKNMRLSSSEIKKLETDLELPLEQIYGEYCRKMRDLSQMDYDDQMVYAYMMLSKTPSVLKHFQDLFQFICVDEAQDTSKIQHMIIELLAGKRDNLFMVGDEDQSIYGFRAAFPQALLDFEKRHKNARVLLMEENFRSNAAIVNAANRFISKNEFRHKKEMVAARNSEAEIQNIELKSRKAQYSYLLKCAENCTRQTAVLYRDNESILPLVDILERANLNYRIRNCDLSFFSHRVVMDIVNIIGFAENPADTALFMKIYYKIGTYLNKNQAQIASLKSEETGLSVLECALKYGNLGARVTKSVKSMNTHLQRLLQESAEKAVYRITEPMGYLSYLDRMNISDSKVQIIKALASNETSAVRLVERFDELSQIIREKKSNPSCKFILSTIHSSKGLEYEKVYLMDVIDGIFPEEVIASKKASLEDRKKYEEERRLFYVGVTRAKDELCLFNISGKSTFISELLGISMEKELSKSGRSSQKSYLKTSVKSPLQRKVKKRIITESEYLDKLEEIRTTGYVNHKQYGEGILKSIHGDVLEIEFADKTAKFKLKIMMEQNMLS